jgi:thiosulfate reductase cytochrome b subunit
MIAPLAMADSLYLSSLAGPSLDAADHPRHAATVRITHWINTFSFFGLLLSGFAILLAHPRFYWGETGTVGTPSLFRLPLPFVLTGQTGWGRSLHFSSAWVCVLSGAFYVVSGLVTGHFRRDLLPRTADLGWRPVAKVISKSLRWERPGAGESPTYNVVQRLTYLGVIFVLFPVAIWTGLAMSPAVTSVFPFLADAAGGVQSARTLHFFAAGFLVLFLLLHIAMVCLAGFRARVWSMIAGRYE